MVGREDGARVMCVHNLQDYFRTSIDDVVSRQQVDIDPHAAHYVVNMLTLFSRSDELYEDDGEVYGLRPLALMLADAADADSVEQRNQLLQRIGDVALFISGFFSDGLASKAVDVDYYIQMGGNAYGSLSDEVRGTFRGRAVADRDRNNLRTTHPRKLRCQQLRRLEPLLPRPTMADRHVPFPLDSTKLPRRRGTAAP